MKQASRILSTYTADVMGVPSALYEMGGLVIMHDASGCNSTYNTHDEPRWYTMPSMVYISALTEMEAVMGDDEKLISDAVAAANELHPRFIAIVGTIIPTVMGTDLTGIARVVEQKTGIPTLGLKTNSMHSYVFGANMAMSEIAERFCDPSARPDGSGKNITVNLLGVTPLDFSITGNAEAMKKIFSDAGFRVQSCWTMGSTWDELMDAGKADVNVVVSSCGLELANTLHKIYGTPYVIGTPTGEKFSEVLFSSVRKAFDSGENQMPRRCNKSELLRGHKTYIIGEAVVSASMRSALEYDFGMDDVHVICPLEADGGVLDGRDLLSPFEEDIFARLKDADILIADPLCRPALPENGARFISLPHEGCSGRIYRRDIPMFIGANFDAWISKTLGV